MIKKTMTLLLLFTAISIFAAIEFDNISYEQINLSVDLPETSFQTVKNEQFGEFTTIPIPGAVHALPGLPDTPSFGNWILIPNGTKPLLSISPGNPIVYENIQLMPAQPQPIDKVDTEPLDFLFDNNVYSQNKFFPEELAFVEATKKKRGQDCTILWISPYQYNPVSKILKFYPDLAVDLSFMGYPQPIPSNLWNDNTIAELKQFGINGNEVVGYEQTLTQREITRDPGCNLLIITDESLLPAAETLAEWKTKLGHITNIVTTSEIGNETIQIQSYIDNAYENWDPAPSYLLFLGDAEHIPTWYVNMHPSTDNGQGMTGSDLYYADTSFPADLLADMGYGRIPIDNLTQAEAVIAKIIDYESTPPNLPSYYNTATCAAYFQDAGGGYAERRFAKTSEDVRNFLTEHDYSVNRLYKTEPATYPLYWNIDYYVFENDIPGEPLPEEIQKPQLAWDAENTDISSAIDAGTYLLLHRDHGWRGGWGDPYYTSLHASNLMNQYLPVVYSINCETGWFDNETDQDECNTGISDESFVEAFLRNNQGAVGVIGASRISFSGNNDRLVWGFMDALWPDFLEWCTADYPEHYPIYQMSDILNFGKEYMMANANYNDEVRTTTVEEFHWFGDPTMRIWTQMPDSLDVIHDSSIDLGGDQMTVTCNQEGAKVSVIFNNEIIGQSTIFNGSSNISFPNIDEMGELLLSVTYPNFYNYITEIEIVPTGPYLVCSNPMFEENGDYNNDLYQALDIVEMGLMLENIGIAITDGDIEVILSNPDNTITLINDTFTVSAINAGDSLQTDNLLSFSINPGVEDSTNIPLNITVVSGESQWDYQFNLLVHAPNISYKNYTFTVLNGNDQIIDPGESVELVLTYQNAGSGWSYNLATTLYSTDPYITINGMDTISEIAPHSEGNTTELLVINVSEDCPIDYYMDISTLAMDAVGSFVDYTFAIPIGILEYNFDIGVTFWEHDTLTVGAIDSWHLSSQRNYTTDGQFSLKCGEENEDYYSNNIFAASYSPIIQLTDNSHLRFYHWMEVGTMPNGFCWDGGYVEMSLDGGDFFQITPIDGYPYETLNIPSLPLPANTPVFAGEIDWDLVDFDLSAYTGNAVFRFVFASSPTLYTMEGWYIDDIQIITYTDSEEDQVIPKITKLLGNHPNPFNPVTEISFQIASDQNIELAVFNLKGQKIKTLANDIYKAGTYNIIWDGTDYNGTQVSSGVYFYQLNTKNQNLTKKMLMLK